MKVPSLLLSCVVVAIDNNGANREVHYQYVVGCWEMCRYLEEVFGIKTVPSTVYNGKKVFSPTLFPYSCSRENFLAYLNWRLNYPKEGRADFFDNEPNKEKFIKNNPIVDVKIKVIKDCR
jgi:hypothetical protein